MWIVAAVLFIAFGVLLSAAAMADWWIVRRRGGQFLAVFIFLSLYMWVIIALPDLNTSQIFAIMIYAIGLLAAMRFLIFLIGDWFEKVHRWAVGVDRMTVPKSYALAEKAEREKDDEGALRFYMEAVAQDMADPEPWRRLGEIRLRLGRLEEALDAFRRAAERLSDPESKVTVLFRSADVLVRLGRHDEARRVVEGVARDFPGTKFEDFARERLGRDKR